MPLPAALVAMLPYLGSAAASYAGTKLGGMGGGGSSPAEFASERFKQIPRFTPQQQMAQSKALESALGLLGNASKPFDFGPIEQQARSQFSQKTIPSIAERFTAMGGQQSSGFQQALGQAGAGLEENLAALKSNVGLQEQSGQRALLASLLGLGMQPSFETAYMPRTPGALERFGAPVLGGLAQSLPLLLMLSKLGAGA